MTHVADGHKIDTTTLRRHFMRLRKIFQGKDKFYSSLLKHHRLGLSLHLHCAVIGTVRLLVVRN